MKPSVQCRWLCFKCSVNRNFNLNIVHHTRKQRQITFGNYKKEGSVKHKIYYFFRRHSRTATVLLHTILTLSLFIPTTIDNEVYSYILIFMAIPQIVICFWVAGELFGLSKNMREKEIEISETAISIEESNESETEME